MNHNQTRFALKRFICVYLFCLAFVFFGRSQSSVPGDDDSMTAQQSLDARTLKKQLHKLSEAGADMDYAEKYLEDYGSINISVPMLAKLGEDFNFNLNQATTNYYSDAKTQVQGAAASFQQTVQSFSLAAQAQMDPTVAAAYASQLQQYFSSLQRYNNKQSLFDQAAEQQLQANLAAPPIPISIQRRDRRPRPRPCKCMRNNTPRLAIHRRFPRTPGWTQIFPRRPPAWPSVLASRTCSLVSNSCLFKDCSTA